MQREQRVMKLEGDAWWRLSVVRLVVLKKCAPSGTIAHWGENCSLRAGKDRIVGLGERNDSPNRSSGSSRVSRRYKEGMRAGSTSKSGVFIWSHSFPHKGLVRLSLKRLSGCKVLFWALTRDSYQQPQPGVRYPSSYIYKQKLK